MPTSHPSRDRPSRTDPVVASLSEAFGGPVGDRAGRHPWWSPVRVLLLLTGLVLALGMVAKSSCVLTAWAGEDQPYGELCWTELAGVSASEAGPPWPTSYGVELAERLVADLPGPTVVATTALLAVVLTALALLTTVLLAGTAPARPWAAAGWAVAPVLAVHWLSWDLVAAVGVAIVLWGWSTGRLAAVGLGALLVVVIAHPLVLTREADVGSVWLLVEQATGWSAGLAQRAGIGLLVVALAGVVALVVVRRSADRGIVAAARAGVVLLGAVLAVASSAPPESALLLLPLAALAVRRWRDLLVWQSCEVVSWVLTGWYLSGALAPTAGGAASAYWLAIVLRIAGIGWLVVAAARSGDDDAVERGRREADPHVDLLSRGRHART